MPTTPAASSTEAASGGTSPFGKIRPAGDPTEGLARHLGAAGFLIAHTGSARGLIFPKGEVPPDAASALEAAGITGILKFGSDDR